MAYIPINAEWYVAEIVEEMTVEGDDRNVVHGNLVLIRAKSPDEAYDRAVELGKRAESVYENPEGRRVVSKFRGLRQLDAVHDRLEHGTELRYSEEVSVPEQRIANLVKSKQELNVFCEIEQSTGPNYSSKDVLEDALRLAGRNSQEPGLK